MEFYEVPRISIPRTPVNRGDDPELLHADPRAAALVVTLILLLTGTAPSQKHRHSGLF